MEHHHGSEFEVGVSDQHVHKHGSFAVDSSSDDLTEDCTHCCHGHVSFITTGLILVSSNPMHAVRTPRFVSQIPFISSAPPTPPPNS